MRRARARSRSGTGTPRRLHLWWARRPLAACRAVLFAQLVDDPSSWPERFPTEEAQGAERKRLHDFIGGTKGRTTRTASSPGRTATTSAMLNQARWYIARSLAWGRGEEPPAEDDPEAVRRYLLDHAPPVYDPFCGGGSIPLEAQRLGLRAYGSDLNPVAVMISKALVEFPPKFAGLPPVNPEARRKLANGGAWNAKGAQGLAEDVRYYGRWMRDEAQKRIGHLYPEVELPDGSQGDGDRLALGAHGGEPEPGGKRRARAAGLELHALDQGRQGGLGRAGARSERRATATGSRSGRARSAETLESEEGDQGVGAANFVCIFTNAPITRAHIRAEGKAERMGARLMAIVAEGSGAHLSVRRTRSMSALPRARGPTWAPETDAEEAAVTSGLSELWLYLFS